MVLPTNFSHDHVFFLQSVHNGLDILLLQCVCVLFRKPALQRLVCIVLQHSIHGTSNRSIGISNQDVTPEEAFRVPELYRSGQRREFFNKRLILWWLTDSLYASASIFFFPLLIYSRLSAFQPGGQVVAAQEFRAAMFTVLVLVPNLQISTL